MSYPNHHHEHVMNARKGRKNESKTIQVEIVGKHRDQNGNPIYSLLILGRNDKIRGLRKLKADHQYSISSYSLKSDLEHFLGAKIVSSTVV